jgi:hypothetical protein
MSVWELLLGALGTLLGLPVLVYYCCKLGTYGALQGQRLFRQHHPDQEVDHAR